MVHFVIGPHCSVASSQLNSHVIIVRVSLCLGRGGCAVSVIITLWDKNRKSLNMTPSSAFLQKFVAISVGNVMEWYDFAIFGSFADIIALQFFPSDKNSSVALLKSFAVFGAAFYVRPIGVSATNIYFILSYFLCANASETFLFTANALCGAQGFLFGHIGDMYGRKKALELSILLMLVASFSIGIIPNFAYIGEHCLGATLCGNGSCICLVLGCFRRPYGGGHPDLSASMPGDCCRWRTCWSIHFCCGGGGRQRHWLWRIRQVFLDSVLQVHWKHWNDLR